MTCTLANVGPKLWNSIIIKNHIEDYTYMHIFKKATKQHIWKTYLHETLHS